MKNAFPDRSRTALLLALTLGACARDDGTYPSLAQRPTEKIGFAEPAVPPPEPLKADPALDAKVAALTARLAAVTTGFDRDRDRAEAAARTAKGRKAGSDPWLDAQTALAQLDDWRAQGTALASEAGDLASARAAALDPAYPTLDALQRRIADESRRQSAAIDRIQATLAPA